MSQLDELIAHDGFGELRVETRILKRGQKEVLIYCGKQYRYVIDLKPADRLVDPDIDKQPNPEGHEL